MTLFYLLTAVICGAYVLLMLSYLYGWSKTAVHTLNIEIGVEVVKVSILVPVRNEERTILNLLTAIFKQTYPNEYFEVIIIDDHSTDGTWNLLQGIHNPNLKVTKLAGDKVGKKEALTQGVGMASGTLIITTDADCEMGEHWLSTIVSFYKEKKPKMIVAPVLLQHEKGMQQVMQAQEMTMLSACAGSALFWNNPILCSGANLVYEKELFLELNGFEGVNKTATGDDVFLMLKVQKKYPHGIKYLKSKEAIVFTNPADTSHSAMTQRKRWASKSFSYGFSYITLIAMLVFSTNFLILFSGIMSAINLKFVFVPAICFLAKILVDFMLLQSASSFFGKKVQPFVFIIASLLYPVYVSFIGLFSPFTNYSWKGRIS